MITKIHLSKTTEIPKPECFGHFGWQSLTYHLPPPFGGNSQPAGKIGRSDICFKIMPSFWGYLNRTKCTRCGPRADRYKWSYGAPSFHGPQKMDLTGVKFHPTYFGVLIPSYL